MRSFLVGLLSLWFAAASFAQSAGDVELIGLGGLYRPDCWIPMRIHIRPGGLKTDNYQVRVYQIDPDGDQVIFTKTISVTGGEAGGSDQRYWMYFQPQPKLPTSAAGFNQRDLSREIKVTLSTKSGKEIATLPITTVLDNIDAGGGSGVRRGAKLILLITDGNSAPVVADYDRGFSGAMLGVMEDLVFISMKASDLPDNPLGLQAADYIVWLNTDPAELHRGGDEKYQALRSWVKAGGNLVICTPSDWQKMNDFGDLLPVVITGSRNAFTLDPLRKLARPPTQRDRPLDDNAGANDKGPFPVALASPLPRAITEEWFAFDAAETDRTPWLVRKTYGAGSVTWVAQDLGDRLNRAVVSTGWPYIWTKVLALHDSPILRTNQMSDDDPRIKPYTGGAPVDLGHSLLQGADLTSTSSLLITIAIVFFLVYWVIAGPGSFVYLASKKRSQHSWVVFGACALAATGLTVVIVKLVLRGPPQAKQVTYIRAVQGESARMQSRIGLYIPRDGAQTIELSEVASGEINTLTALPVHDALITDPIESKASVEYVVPVRELGTEGAPEITVPYRSTLKKFKVQWVGEYNKRIEGAVALDNPAKKLSGSLTNGTNGDLTNIYIVFNYPGAENNPNTGDYIVYLPEWQKGVTMDVTKLIDERDERNNRKTRFITEGTADVPESNKRLQGRLKDEWEKYFFSAIRAKTGTMSIATYNDFGDKIQRSFPVMSLFERFAPMQNRQSSDRADIIRHGGRSLDVSGAVASGSLVILAQGVGALPYPAKVEGEPITAEGPIYYQFILPIDRSAVEKTGS